MALPDLPVATITELLPLLRQRQVSPVEVTQRCLDRIEAWNPTLHAYISVLADEALQQARDAEVALMRGQARSPLHGVPVSIKDVFRARGTRTTWGVKDLAEYHAAEDAAVVTRLRQAGAVILGKTNVDAYPHYSSTHPRLIGPTSNPWHFDRSAGRSSGGSGASVAARLDYGSIGSDTGGSIRIPAAFCGVVGLKPTAGLVSSYGAFPYSSTFDTCGPLARCARDAALLLEGIARPDPRNTASLDSTPVDYTARLNASVGDLRVGMPRAATEHIDPQVERLFDAALEVLVDRGLKIQAIELPSDVDTRWLNVMCVLEIAAVKDSLVPTPRSPDAYTSYLVDRDAVGRQRLLAQGHEVMEVARARYRELFRTVDLIATPTVPMVAPRLTDTSSPWQLPDEPFVEMIARLTHVFNLIGYPAVSVPCGLTAEGLPVGLQLAGRPLEDARVLRVAHAYESATDWHTKPPRGLSQAPRV